MVTLASARRPIVYRSLAALLVLSWVLGMAGVMPPQARAADAQLDLEKTATATTLLPGQFMNYTFQVNCSSLTVDCVDVVLTDKVPEGLTVTSVPNDTAEVDYNYDPATRVFTAKFIAPLDSPPGQLGLQAGAKVTVQLGVQLPADTLLSPTTLTNTATAAGTNTNEATDSADVQVEIPVKVNPIAQKAWTPNEGIAQSGAASKMVLRIINSSSTTAQVTSLTLSDLPSSTFNYFDVTAVGPVTYPPGADQVRIQLCTVPITVPGTCPAALVDEGIKAGAGPFTLTTPLASITGLVFTFSNAAGTVLPASTQPGTVEVGTTLRNTLRTDGSEIQPTAAVPVDNTVVPSAVNATEPDAPVVGAPAKAVFTIRPNTLLSATAKTFANAGPLIEGQGSELSWTTTSINKSGFAVSTIIQQDPDPSSAVTQNAFEVADVYQFVVSPPGPGAAQSVQITVTCRGGSTKTVKASTKSDTTLVVHGDLSVNNGQGPLCPAGDFPKGYVATVTSNPEPPGIPNNGGLKIVAKANINASATAGTQLQNCGVTGITNPSGGTGTGVSNSCVTGPTVVKPSTPGESVGGAEKSAGDITTIVPGQPLTFILSFKNTGNLPLVDVVLQDPPNPLAADNPFNLVRLVSVDAPGSPAGVVEVYDPDVSGWVAYNATDTALLERALGVRIRITDNVPVGATYKASYTVLLRDGVPGGAQFKNCAVVGVGAGFTSSPFCTPDTITADVGTYSGTINKQFNITPLIRPYPGQNPATIQTTQLQIQIRNTGSLYVDRLIATDVDKDFWQAFEPVGSDPQATLPPGADRVKLEICYTFADCGSGKFPFSRVFSGAPGATIPLGTSQSEVAPALGFRLTFFNSSGGFKLTPSQASNYNFFLAVRPRTGLLDDNGVLTTTPIPDVSENTVTGAASSLLQNPEETFPFGPASADVTVVDGPAKLDFKKGPDLTLPPGQTGTFSLKVTNEGQRPIPDLYVRDPLPTTLDFVDSFAGAPPGQPYLISYSVPAGTPTPPQVVFTADETTTGTVTKVSQLNWRFPGFSLLPGAVITISFNVRLAPGVPPGTAITNVGGVTSEQTAFTWTCGGTVLPGGGLGTPPSATPWCSDGANVTVQEGTSFSASKWSTGDPALGFLNTLTGQVVATSSTVCPRIVVGGVTYTRYPCVARNYPGQGFFYLMVLTNLSNNANALKVRLLDTLPVQGDTGVILNGQARGTQWSAPPRLLTALTPQSAKGSVASGYTTFDTVAQDICFAQLTGGTLPTGCTNAAFDATFPADAGSISAFEADVTYSGDGLGLGEASFLTFKVSSPLQVAAPSDTSAAWNSFAVQEQMRNIASGAVTTPRPTEPIKAGLAMVYGRVQVTKSVLPAGLSPVPGPFPVAYRCTATAEVVNGGQSAPQTVAEGSLSVAAGATVEIPGPLPAGAVCKVWETDALGGQSGQLGEANAVSLTVAPSLLPSGEQPPQLVTITNDFSKGEIELVKTADVQQVESVGDEVTYTFVATNTGNVPLAGVEISDPLPNLSALSCTPAGAATLAPGEKLTCKATYEITQADLDAGKVVNTATVTGTPPTGPPVTGTDTETVTTPAAPGIELVKTADVQQVDSVGDVITYKFVATNTGNVTLTGVVVSDPLFGVSPVVCDRAAPVKLAPGEKLTCTATYSVTQADLDAGAVDNTATTTGTPPTGPPVTDTAPEQVPTVAGPGIDLVKSADVTELDAAGDVVTYTFVATNTGNVTLKGVTITDPLPNLSPLSCTPAAPVELAPGGKLTCTATYTVTQADLDAGKLDNTATATGTPPTGPPVTGTDTETVTGAQSPAIGLVKTADMTEVDAAGDVVTYTFVATNTGNVTLKGVAITDPLPNLSPLSCTPAAPAELAPGGKLTCTASYTVTQADLDAGKVVNTATVTGTPPTGPPVTGTDTAEVTGVPDPGIEVVKTADVAQVSAVGDVITYTFVATNTGNVTLTGVEITDPLPGLSDLVCEASGPTRKPAVQPLTLMPGEELTCTATYTVTQGDLDAGAVDNLATVTGQPPTGEEVTSTDPETVPAAQDPAIGLVKAADVALVDGVGDVITYTFVATNTGNVTLTEVEITDPLPGLSALTCDQQAPVALAPGEALTCTATYRVTQADLDAGSLTNVATATGQPPTGDPVTDEASTEVETEDGSLVGTGAAGWLRGGGLLALLSITAGIALFGWSRRREA